MRWRRKTVKELQAKVEALEHAKRASMRDVEFKEEQLHGADDVIEAMEGRIEGLGLELVEWKERATEAVDRAARLSQTPQPALTAPGNTAEHDLSDRARADAHDDRIREPGYWERAGEQALSVRITELERAPKTVEMRIRALAERMDAAEKKAEAAKEDHNLSIHVEEQLKKRSFDLEKAVKEETEARECIEKVHTGRLDKHGQRIEHLQALEKIKPPLVNEVRSWREASIPNATGTLDETACEDAIFSSLPPNSVPREWELLCMNTDRIYYQWRLK